MARLHLLRETDLHNCYWGVSTSLWFNGCPHRCLGCWNQESWEIDESLSIPNSEIVERTLIALDDPIPKDLTLLGGEPLMPGGNLEDSIEIVSAILKERPKTRVLCWTGFRIEQIIKNDKFRPMLQMIDILIDGRYEKDLHVVGEKYGSTNQRIIDMKETLKTGSVVIAPDNYERGKL